MSESAEKELSPLYYLENFRSVLAHVQKLYGHLLEAEELKLVADFQGLSQDAQALYLRLAGRKAQWFFSNGLNYAEIMDIHRAIQELMDLDWVHAFQAEDWAQVQGLLQQCSLKDLQQLGQVLGLEKKPSSFPKVEWLNAMQDFPHGQVYQAIVTLKSLPIRLDQRFFYAFYQFLFFGSAWYDIKEFVIRDLGHRQYHTVDEAHLKPYFKERIELVQKWNIAQWRSQLAEWGKTIEDPVLAFRAFEQTWMPVSEDIVALARPGFERALYAFGRQLERSQAPELALQVYALSYAADALERRIRILDRMGDQETALALANLGLATLNSPDAQHFFGDYLAKQANKAGVKKVSERLKQAHVLELAPVWKGQVEAGVMAHYTSLGYQAFFTENWFWKGMFGLVCWDLIFQKENDFHHPFQIAPSNFRREEFALGSLKALDQHLSQFQGPDDYLKFMKLQSQRHWGQANPLVYWEDCLIPLAEVFFKEISSSAFEAILRGFWQHLPSHGRGFPDVFIYKPGEAFFLEVKSPTDHLSAHQYFWMDFLNANGIACRIQRVAWKNMS